MEGSGKAVAGCAQADEGAEHRHAFGVWRVAHLDGVALTRRRPMNWKPLLANAHDLTVRADAAIAEGRQDEAITLLRERASAIDDLVRALRPDLFVRQRKALDNANGA
jgi:hypothetical protein